MTTTWITIAVTLLKLAHSLVEWLNKRNMLQAGQDQAIAAAALLVFEETEAGKQLREHIENLEEDDALALWDRMLEHG